MTSDAIQTHSSRRSDSPLGLRLAPPCPTMAGGAATLPHPPCSWEVRATRAERNQTAEWQASNRQTRSGDTISTASLCTQSHVSQQQRQGPAAGPAPTSASGSGSCACAAGPTPAADSCLAALSTPSSAAARRATVGSPCMAHASKSSAEQLALRCALPYGHAWPAGKHAICPFLWYVLREAMLDFVAVRVRVGRKHFIQ